MLREKIETKVIKYRACDFCNTESGGMNLISDCEDCGKDYCKDCGVELYVCGYAYSFCKECYNKHSVTLDRLKVIEEQVLQLTKESELLVNTLNKHCTGGY